MKKRIITILSVLLVASFCFSVTAYAATTYTSDLEFQGEHEGTVRSYTGSDISWKGTTSVRKQASHMGDTFKVTLYRKNFIGTSLIGTVEMKRSGSNSKKWTNVGSGKYYFFYTKARDGAVVYSDKITMKMS